MIIRELKRYIISPLFLVATAAALCVMIYPFFDMPPIFGSVKNSCLYYINLMHTFGTFDLFAPAIAAIPCGAAFYNDFKSGLCKFILPRTTRIKYLVSKALACGMAGGLALLVPSGVFFIFSGIIGGQASDTHLLFGTSVLGEMLILLMLTFLFGAAWSLVGLAFSAFIPNKFAVYTAPFMLYFAASLILGLNDKTLKFSPINLLYPNFTGAPKLYFFVIYQIILMVLAAGVFIIRADRRLKNDL